MSDAALDFDALTEEDFAQIDAAVAQELLKTKQNTCDPDESIQFDSSGAVDLATLTDEDFASIDAAIALARHALPQISIELEQPHPSQVGGGTFGPEDSERIRTSPLVKFRPNKILSVTDFAAPTWCEVQFDYGLYGKRSKPIATRPKSFRSATGKKIEVKQALSMKNEVRKEIGTAVHKKLELEVRPEEVKVVVKTKEERWALRLLNMMSCLQGMVTDGFTREMPIFGVIHNIFVIGVMDEITMKPINRQPVFALGRAISGSPSPEDILGACASTSSSRSADSHDHEPTGVPPISYNLFVSDTKTRQGASLPPPEDSIGSQIQLMLYHRLLNELLSTSPYFDFSSFWSRLDLNPSKSFSKRFLAEAKFPAPINTPSMTCLDGLSQAFLGLVREMRIAGVDPTLEIIYRSRTSKKEKALKLDGPHVSEGSTSTLKVEDTLKDIISVEDRDLQWALEESLRPTDHVPVNGLKRSQSRSPSPGENGSDKAKGILGTTLFKYDGAFLDNHVDSILKWWYGERKPRGVSIDLVRRCRTCEYSDDCEWREQKAFEVTSKGG